MLPCLPDLLGCALFLSAATLELAGALAAALAAGCTLVGLLAIALLCPVVASWAGCTAAAAAALVAPRPILLGSSAVITDPCKLKSVQTPCSSRYVSAYLKFLFR